MDKLTTVSRQLDTGYTDQVSLDAIAKRWTKFFADLPHLLEAGAL